MSWAPDYCAVAELAAMVLPVGQTTSSYDAQMQIAISAASAAVDKASNRQFGNTGTAEERFYSFCGLRIDGHPAIAIDDVQDTTGFAVEYSDLAPVLGTDYKLWPYNAAAKGKPFTHIVLTRYARHFPHEGGDVSVTAIFGWTSVPPAVKLACLIQAGRFFVRKDSLYGVAGSPDTGSETRLLAKLDPDVALNITSVRRMWGAITDGGRHNFGVRLDALDYYTAVGGWV